MKRIYYIYLLTLLSLNAFSQPIAQRVDMLSAELRGIFGTGGLQHAVLDKGKYIQQNGHQVRFVIPFYTTMEDLDLKNYEVVYKDLKVKMDEGKAIFNFDVVQFTHPESEKLLITSFRHKPGDGFQNIFNNRTTDGSKIYSLHPHDGETFGTFAKAYRNWIDQVEVKIQPDIVVLNDWHTGVTGAFLSERKEHYKEAVKNKLVPAKSKKIPFVQGVIHNLKYQGVYNNSLFDWLGIDSKLYGSMEMHGDMNYLKTMLEHSDYVEAVSKQYAREITTPEFGERLHTVTSRLAREGKLSGLINGIDPEKWDPKKPGIDDSNYRGLEFDANDMRKKDIGTQKLVQEFFGETPTDKTITVALTARIDHQKGYSFLLGDDGLFNKLLSDETFDVKILLAGDPFGPRDQSPLVQELEQLQRKFPKKISINAFSPDIERKFLYYANAYFGGSVFEPSGLTQMFSQSVGTIPVVSNLGGHVDSVVDGKTGILFDVVQPNGVLNKEATVNNALEAFNKLREIKNDKNMLSEIRKTMIHTDNSWANRVRYFEKFIDLAHVGVLDGYNGKANSFGKRDVIDIDKAHLKLHNKGTFCGMPYIKALGLRY